MYSRVQLASKFISYYLHASNGKGHGIHSPFVFDFVKNVLNKKADPGISNKIESIRHRLLKNNSIIQVYDFGAGSAMIKQKSRAVNKIAATSLKNKKYAQLLHRMVKYYDCNIVVELGTSFGITTTYMAAASRGTVYTLEGDPEIAAIAKNNFEQAGIKNTEIKLGDFNKTLPQLLSSLPPPDFVFIDGNHRKNATLDYFNQLIIRSDYETILVFDDIHWSHEMEDAWLEIKNHPDVTLTIDLFFIGLVFFRKEFKAKQHFVIRF